MKTVSLSILIMSLLVCPLYAADGVSEESQIESKIEEAEQALYKRFPSGRARARAEKRLDDVINKTCTHTEKLEALNRMIAEWGATPNPGLKEAVTTANAESVILSPAPLSWSISAIKVGWKIDQSVSSTEIKRFNKTLSEKTGRDLTYENALSITTTETDGYSWDLGGGIQGSAGFSLKNWLPSGHISSGVEGHAKAGKSFSMEKRTSNTMRNTVSVNDQLLFQNTFETLAELQRSIKLDDMHLVFSVNFQNNTDKPIILNKGELPICSSRGETILNAYPEVAADRIVVYPNRSNTIRYRASIKDTNALAALQNFDFKIALDNSSITAQSEAEPGRDLIAEAKKMNRDAYAVDFVFEGTTFLPLKIANRYQGGTVTFNILFDALNKAVGETVLTVEKNAITRFGTLKSVSGKHLYFYLETESGFTPFNPAAPITSDIKLNALYLTTDLKTLFDDALLRNDPAAQYNLANLFFEGKVLPKNDATAVKFYHKAAEQGHAEAQCNLGFSYCNAQNYNEAVKWFRKAAEQGHADAQTCLGARYDHGEGVPQNHAEAVKWYRKAAEQGDEYAKKALITLETRANNSQTPRQNAPSTEIVETESLSLQQVIPAETNILIGMSWNEFEKTAVYTLFSDLKKSIPQEMLDDIDCDPAAYEKFKKILAKHNFTLEKDLNSALIAGLISPDGKEPVVAVIIPTTIPLDVIKELAAAADDDGDDKDEIKDTTFNGKKAITSEKDDKKIMIVQWAPNLLVAGDVNGLNYLANARAPIDSNSIMLRSIPKDLQANSFFMVVNNPKVVAPAPVAEGEQPQFDPGNVKTVIVAGGTDANTLSLDVTAVTNNEPAVQNNIGQVQMMLPMLPNMLKMDQRVGQKFVKAISLQAAGATVLFKMQMDKELAKEVGTALINMAMTQMTSEPGIEVEIEM